MKKPLTHYETKLAEFKELYKNSTNIKDRNKYVNYCADYRARIRYWKLHANEYKGA